MNIHCTLGLIFFSFWNLQSYNLSFKNLTPPQLASAQMVFVPPLEVKKRRNWCVLLTPFRKKIRMRGAFIVAFTSEKQWMTLKISLFCNWPLIQHFFIAHWPFLVQCKTKGTVGAVVRLTAHLAIVCLMANCCMRWLSQDGERADFSNTHRDTSFYKDLSN